MSRHPGIPCGRWRFLGPVAIEFRPHPSTSNTPAPPPCRNSALVMHDRAFIKTWDAHGKEERKKNFEKNKTKKTSKRDSRQSPTNQSKHIKMESPLPIASASNEIPSSSSASTLFHTCSHHRRTNTLCPIVSGLMWTASLQFPSDSSVLNPSVGQSYMRSRLPPNGRSLKLSTVSTSVCWHRCERHSGRQSTLLSRLMKPVEGEVKRTVYRTGTTCAR